MEKIESGSLLKTKEGKLLVLQYLCLAAACILNLFFPETPNIGKLTNILIVLGIFFAVL
jgi:hypothetical protein